nr:zinc finger, CCHC-type, retrotransposon Gag domain protein [Tanacetum cinerariifolium]
MVSEPGYETVGSKDLTYEDWMVNTRTDAELAAAVRNALQTLLPQIRAEISEEFRTGSGPSGSGGNPPPVTIHTWLKRFNKQKPRSFEKATAPVNSRAEVQSPKSRYNIKPAKRIPNVNKHERWISKGYRFSPNKSFAMHKKLNTLRSYLRWKPTGRIFKTDGLRWIPTGKIFTDSTTKVDNEPPNGSNDDITNPYECDQTLYVSVYTLNLSADTSFNPKRKDSKFGC